MMALLFKFLLQARLDALLDQEDGEPMHEGEARVDDGSIQERLEAAEAASAHTFSQIKVFQTQVSVFWGCNVPCMPCIRVAASSLRPPFLCRYLSMLVKNQTMPRICSKC